MKKLLLAVAALLLLSGCEVKAQLVLKDDGSGTFTYVVGIDKDFLARMEAGADPLGAMRKNAESQSYEVTLVDYETDKLKGIRASFDFSDVDDLKVKLASSQTGAQGQTGDQAAAAASAFAFDVLGLTRTDTGWKLTANAGVATEANQQLPFDRAELDKLLDAEFSATLPGNADRHNADKVSKGKGGTTFTWDLLAGEGNLDLQAETSSKEDSFPIAAVATVGVLVLGGGAFLALRRRRSAATPSAD